MKRSIQLTLPLIFLLAFVACNQDSSKEKTVFTGPKTLNMATFWIPDNADPKVLWNGWILTRFGVGENLVQFDENEKLKCVIAKSWEQRDDFTIEFIIRRGITFSNGNKVDAEACKASLERALKETDRSDVVFPVDSIIADGQKLTVKTLSPAPIAINLLADPVYNIIDTSAIKDDPDFALHPVTTGPFKIIEYIPGESIKLSRNETYWKCDVNVDVVNVRYYPDASTRAMALQTGEVDFTCKINPTDIRLFENDDYTVRSGSNLRTAMLLLNMKKPYMKELDFRKSLSYGMDKETYARDLLGLEPALGPFLDTLDFAYTGEDYYKYNPAKANELLDGLGYLDNDGDGVREYNTKNIVLEFGVTSSGGESNTVALAIQSQLKEIGIGINIMQYENSSNMIKTGAFDMYRDAWVTAPMADPQFFLESVFQSRSSNNHSSYSNADFDEKCLQFNTLFTKEERNQLGVDATEILLKDVAGIFLYHQNGTIITRKNITGVYRYMNDICHIDERVNIEDE